MSNNEIKLPGSLDADAARDVLREFASTDDATIVSSDRIDALESEITEAKEAFAAVLAEESPQSADTLARQDMDALTEPFRDEDGDLDVDTLRQEPETGDVDATPEGGDDTEPTIDALGRSDREAIRTKRQKMSTFQSRNMSGRVDSLQREIAGIVGAESYDDIADDVEGL